MRAIDEQYLKTPFYGRRRITIAMQEQGFFIGQKRVRTVMQLMGLEAIYPKPNLSVSNKDHKKYPYLMRDLVVDHPDQAWAADITYIPMPCGFGYLFAIIDWFSRYVIEWELSNMLDIDFCMEALERSLIEKHPDIFNTDQGVQFTSNYFTGRLEKDGIQVRRTWKKQSWISIPWSGKHPKLLFHITNNY